MSKIIINYDFNTDKELSYHECKIARKLEMSFETCCISMFSFDALFLYDYEDVIVKRKDGRYISAKELLENTGGYTDRNIRKAHNLQKMLTAGAFEWMSPIKDS